MEFKNIVINSVLIGIVIISLLAFSGQFAIEQSTNQSIMSENKLQVLNSSIYSQLEDSTTTANNSLQAYQDETKNPVLTALGFYFRSIIDAGTTFFTITTSIFGYIPTIVQDYTAIPPIVTGSFMIILTILILLGIWSTLRAGR